jgi:hypothetical protein
MTKIIKCANIFLFFWGGYQEESLNGLNCSEERQFEKYIIQNLLFWFQSIKIGNE